MQAHRSYAIARQGQHDSVGAVQAVYRVHNQCGTQAPNDGTHFATCARSPEDVALDTAEKSRVALLVASRPVLKDTEDARNNGVDRNGTEAARRRKHC
jgi:hypothetical protein